MRAKTVNEQQDFERGRDPRVTLGVGGVNPWNIQEEIDNNAEKEWDDYVKSFIGKKVSGIFSVSPFKKEQCSFKVKAAEYESRSGIPLSITIEFEDDDGNFYSFDK